MDEPLAVALKFGFLAVLYLFLLWVARSALRDLRVAARAAAAEDRPRPAAPRRTRARRPRGGVQPRLEVVAAMGYEPGTSFDVAGGVTMGRSRRRGHQVEDPFASSAPRAHLPARRVHVHRGHGVDERDLPQRPPATHGRAAQAWPM